MDGRFILSLDMVASKIGEHNLWPSIFDIPICKIKNLNDILAKAGKILMIPDELVANKIYLIRGQKAMLDRDLAELYGVETKVLNQAVKRNAGRFPEDFMFQLTAIEFENLKSQIVTSSWGESGNCLMLLPNRELPCYPEY